MTENFTLTNSDDSQVATDQTDVTDVVVTNDEFLTAIFGCEFKMLKPLVCSKPGNPDGESGWKPKPWPCDTSDSDLNWYALPSLYGPNVQGYYRAQKKLADQVYCAMLDDVVRRRYGRVVDAFVLRPRLIASWVWGFCGGRFSHNGANCDKRVGCCSMSDLCTARYYNITI